MNATGKIIGLGLLLAGLGAAQERAPIAGWPGNLTVTAAGTVNRVDNLSRTSNEPNRKDAATYELSLSATRHHQLASSWLLHAGAQATLFHVPDYDLTNHFKAGPQLGLQYKFGLGPLAPVLQFDTAFTYKSARLAADRGWTAEASLRLARRFTPAFKAGVSGLWLKHSARSTIFDLAQHSYSLDATWDISERWSLSGSAGRLSGYIAANAAPAVWSMALSGGSGPVVAAYYNSRPWVATHLYGPDWVSYNVEADVDLWSLALSCALTENTSVEFRHGRALVVNKIAVRYPTESWGLGLVHRF